MKKFYAILVAIFAIIQLNASHIKGGEIYYDYVSGTTYDIYLVLYADPTGIALGASQTITAQNGFLTTTINLSQIANSQFQLGCGFSAKAHVYKATCNLGTITATGTELSWSSCCRAGGITNLSNSAAQSFYISTKMYPIPGTTVSSSSARFYSLSNISGNTVTNNFNTGAFDPDPSDSIFISLIPAYGAVSTPLSYVTGYSATNPFGTAAGNSILDSQSGLFSVNGVAAGAYQVAMAVESYYNGMINSVSRREVTYHMSATADSLPSTQISNVVTTGVSTSTNGNYFVEMNASDVLSFDVTGIVNSADSLTLRGYSTRLTNNSGAGGNCAGANCITFTPSGGSFTNIGISQGSVSFSPTSTAVPVGANAAYYTLVFESAVTGSCNEEHVDAVSVVVKVNANQSIWAPSSFDVCQGSSGQVQINGDTTNLHWSPSVGVSDTTSASPFLFPTATTLYTITNLNNGDQISLVVNVDSIVAPVLTSSGTHAIIPNYSDYDGAVWYYNGVAIAQNVDSVAMPVAGSYFAIVTKGACSAQSNSITFTNKNQIVVNGTSGGTPILVNADGMFSMQFMVNDYTNILNNMVLVIADELTLKTTTPPSIEIKTSSNQVIYSGTATAIDDVMWEVASMNLTLNANESYSLQVVFDAGNIVLFAPTALPYTEDNGVVTVTSASYNNGTAQSDAFPYVVFGVANGIGLEESAISANIYPQPMSDMLTIEITGSAQFEILDAVGRVLISSIINDKTELNTSALPAGVYMYKLQQNGAVKTGKLVK